MNSSAKRATSLGPCQFPESDDDAVITNTEAYITETGAKKEIVTENGSFYTRSAHPNGLYKISVRDTKDDNTGNGFVTKVNQDHNDLHQNGYVPTHSYSPTENYSEGKNHKLNGGIAGCNGYHDVKF